MLCNLHKYSMGPWRTHKKKPQNVFQMHFSSFSSCVCARFICSPLNSSLRRKVLQCYGEVYCQSWFGLNWLFPSKIMQNVNKMYGQYIWDINNGESGHTSTEQTMQIKRLKTKLRANSISTVKALCTAGIQEGQHLNRAGGRVENESGWWRGNVRKHTAVWRGLLFLRGGDVWMKHGADQTLSSLN